MERDVIVAGKPGGEVVNLSNAFGDRQANAHLIRIAPVLPDLHASEINFEISTFYDGGFQARLGDPLNGFKAEDRFRTFVEAVEQLRDWAVAHFPNSEFANRYRRTA